MENYLENVNVLDYVTPASVSGILDEMDPELAEIVMTGSDGTETRAQVKERLDDVLILARKFGYDEYIDTITQLMEKMHRMPH